MAEYVNRDELNVSIGYMTIYSDSDGNFKFNSPLISSPGFDGFIPYETASFSVASVNAGNQILISSASNTSLGYRIVDVEKSAQYSSAGNYIISYLVDNSIQTASYSSSADLVVVEYEDWDNVDIGENGWAITYGGNAIFSNIIARGRIEAKEGYIGGQFNPDGTSNGWEITSNLFSNASVGFYAPSAISGQIAIFAGAPFENRASAVFRVGYDGSMVASSANITGALTATTLDVGGANGITYNGASVIIGTGVIINSSLTAESLQVGTTPNILKISASPNGVAGEDGIFISSANYWYSTGKFSLGGSQGITFNSGSVVIGTDVYVNAAVTVNALSVGTIPTILRISASSGGLGNDGIYINTNNYWYSDGRFSVGGSVNNTVWTGSSLVVTGSINATNINASVGNIAGFTLASNSLSATNIVLSSSGGLRLGASSQFSVDQNGNLIATSASIIGNITATSGSFTGAITAQAGTFTGALGVTNSGVIYAGTDPNSGQRINLSSSGLYGYHSNGLEAFALPISGSPRIGTFTIIPTGIVSQSASNANMIYGNVDSSGSVTDGIVIRGFRTTGASAAIFTVQNGTPTDFSSGNGFYVDENGRFKLAGGSGSLTFDGNNLSITGNINATSGSFTGAITAETGRFTGSVVAQHITASIGSIAGFVLANNQLSTASVIVSSSGGFRLGNPTVFSVDQFGNMSATSASIIGDIRANSGSIAGWRLNTGLLSGTSASILSSGDIKLGSGQTIVALSSTDTNRIWAGSAVSSTAPFKVSSTGFLTATGASITGNINATSGSFRGDITASSGRFVGNVSVSENGTIFAGSSISSGARTTMTASALSGFDPNGELNFTLIATPKALTNIIANPSFESGTGSWTPFAGSAYTTWSSNSSSYQYGSFSLQQAQSSQTLYYVSAISSSAVPVTSNKKYYVSAWFLTNVAFSWDEVYGTYDSTYLYASTGSTVAIAQNSIGQFVSSYPTGEINKWFKISGVVTIPSTDTYISVKLIATNNAFVSRTILWDYVEVYDYIEYTSASNIGKIGRWSFNSTDIFSDSITLSPESISLSSENSSIDLYNDSNLNLIADSDANRGKITFISSSVTQAQIVYKPSTDSLLINKTNGSTMSSIALAAGVGGSVTINNSHFSANGATLFVNSSTSRVGVGTISPNFKLDVNGTLRVSNTATFDDTVVMNSAASITGAANVTLINGDLRVFNSTNNDFPFRATNGTSSATALVQSRSIFQYQSAATTNLVRIGADPYTMMRSTSTVRIKEDLMPLSGSISGVPIEKMSKIQTKINPYDVLLITPTEFRSTALADEKQRFLGFIAEDVSEKFNWAAGYDDDGTPSNVSDRAIVAALLEVVKRQQKELESLKIKMIQLESTIEGNNNV